MYRNRRLIAAGFALVLVSALAGCGSMPSYDPTDLLDFLDTKKKAPGERKPVFPNGVPGVTQGIPKEMIKGSPESQAAAAPPVEAAPEPAPPPAATKRSKSAKRTARAPRQPQVEIAPDDVNVDQGTTTTR